MKARARSTPRKVKLRSSIALVGVLALIALASASPADAGLRSEFAVFNDCPVETPGVSTCIVSYTTGGEFHLGSKTVPINKTITLQGGVSTTTPNLVPAVDGDTLSRTPLQLPGGLIGVELLPPLTEVTATAELAGPVALNLFNFVVQSGPAISVPLQIKLDNPSLGSTCYIGSSSSPVEPTLTDGTTSPPAPAKPISGARGTIGSGGAGMILVITGSSLVDNTFAVPGANGCGGPLSPIVDPSVNLIAGLPAAAGQNTAVLNGSLEQASAELVKAQRELPEFGRCRKLGGETSGSFANAGCTTPKEAGAYEWTTAPGAHPGFALKGGALSLEAVGGAAGLSCKHTTARGTFTGAKSTSATLTLTGCKLAGSKVPCHSAGAGAGKIVTSPLEGTLGFIKDTVEAGKLQVSVGLDLQHSPALLTAECKGGEQVTVAGSVIAPFRTIEKTSSANTLSFSESGGSQLPEAFEEGPADTLSASFGAQPAQASGLLGTVKLHSEEPVEIKGEAHRAE